MQKKVLKFAGLFRDPFFRVSESIAEITHAAAVSGWLDKPLHYKAFCNPDKRLRVDHERQLATQFRQTVRLDHPSIHSSVIYL